MREYIFYVYISASCRNGTLYVGMTNDIIGRVWEHREGHGSKFTAKYGVNKLMYFETFEDVLAPRSSVKPDSRSTSARGEINLIQRDNIGSGMISRQSGLREGR